MSQVLLRHRRRRRPHPGRAAVYMLFTAVSLSMPATAKGVPSLQVAPLQYEQALPTGKVSNGFIDVSNPTAAPVEITSAVRSFKQIGTAGDLEFFDDADLSRAVTVGLPNFSLGPREAVRVAFTVDSSKLPQGGVYGAVFFRTTPVAPTSSSSYVSQSANVGTLLLLTNGPVTKHRGQVAGLSVPLVQIGSELRGNFTFKNTGGSVGFKPKLAAAVWPWGMRTATSTGLVLPGVTRQFELNKRGSYFGLLPIQVRDADSGASAMALTLAVTGWYRVAAPIVVVLGFGVWWLIRRRRSRYQKT